MRDPAFWSGVIGMIGSILLMIPSVFAVYQRKVQTDLDTFLGIVNKQKLATELEKEQLFRSLHITARDYWLTLLGAALICVSFALLLAANVDHGGDRAAQEQSSQELH